MSESQWPKRPYDPDCTETVPIDENTVAVIRKVITDWDPLCPNWLAVRDKLQDRGKTDEQIARMDIFEIRTALASGMKRILQVSGVSNTTEATWTEHNWSGRQYVAAPDVHAKLGIPADKAGTVKKRLERLRKRIGHNPDVFMDVSKTTRGRSTPDFVYNVASKEVQDELADLRA